MLDGKYSTIKISTKIQWTKLPNHPGNARYRIAAGGSEKDQKIYFSGGTDNPYNYNGIGYDGKPARAVSHDICVQCPQRQVGNHRCEHRPTRPWIIAGCWSSRKGW